MVQSEKRFGIYGEIYCEVLVVISMFNYGINLNCRFFSLFSVNQLQPIGIFGRQVSYQFQRVIKTESVYYFVKHQSGRCVYCIVNGCLKKKKRI